MGATRKTWEEMTLYKCTWKWGRIHHLHFSSILLVLCSVSTGFLYFLFTRHWKSCATFIRVRVIVKYSILWECKASSKTSDVKLAIFDWSCYKIFKPSHLGRVKYKLEAWDKDSNSCHNLSSKEAFPVNVITH